MTTMIHPTNANGRRRPSLGEQINRLDSMLDGLSEGLNEAVADAVKAGVGTAAKEAVQAVLMEMLTNPDLRARLFPPALPVAKLADPDVLATENATVMPQPRRGWWQRVRACIDFLRTACETVLHAVDNSLSHAWQCTCAHCAAAWANCGMLWPYEFQIQCHNALSYVVIRNSCCANVFCDDVIVRKRGGFCGLCCLLTTCSTQRPPVKQSSH